MNQFYLERLKKLNTKAQLQMSELGRSIEIQKFILKMTEMFQQNNIFGKTYVSVTITTAHVHCL